MLLVEGEGRDGGKNIGESVNRREEYGGRGWKQEGSGKGKGG